MDRHLKDFLLQWLGVVSIALSMVIFAAFVSMPVTLGFHPGEAGDRPSGNEIHMT